MNRKPSLKFFLVLIPVVLWIAQEIYSFGLGRQESRALVVLVTMALWWITEALPMHWVAIVPLALVFFFPFAKAPWWNNVLTVAEPYAHPLIFLFMGGMLIAQAMEEHNLHKRIALNIIRMIGSNPRRILLGFLLSTAFISLWISNTATAVMMVPIGMAVVSQIEAREGRRLPLFGQSIMLSIAYASNVGGIGTLIGTAPNVIYAGFVGSQYKVEVGFLPYLVVGFPFVVMFIPIIFGALAWLCRKEDIQTVGSEVIDAEIAKLGPVSRFERVVMTIFLVTCSAWILNQPIRSLTGLLLKGDEFDGCVSLLAGASLFALGALRGGALKRLGWDSLILLGGSLALAAVIQSSGLSNRVAGTMSAAAGLPPLGLMLVVTMATVFLSAFTSNMATTTIMLLLVADALDPKRGAPGLAMPYLSGVVIASSCDFMLPCGTPPNAIAFGTRYVKMSAMASTGAVLDALAAVLVALWVYFGASRLLPLVIPALGS